MKEMKQFLRIANARLRKVYPNKQQRRAWAAKMYSRWMSRKQNGIGSSMYQSGTQSVR